MEATEGEGEVGEGVQELGQEAQQPARDGAARMVAHMVTLKDAAGAANPLVRGQERAGAALTTTVERVELRENRTLLGRMENR